MILVEKRNGTKVPFNRTKIEVAIEKAMNSPSGFYVLDQAKLIASSIEEYLIKNKIEEISIRSIEKLVIKLLNQEDNMITAIAYEKYRSLHEYMRQENTSDNSILAVIENSDEDIRDNNSNKDPTINNTQRDLIAGEVSKDILKRKLLPQDILEAWENNILWFHDADYAIQPEFNCCLIDLKDMLENGTCISGKRIDTPKSFQVACTVATQAIFSVSSNQYGLVNHLS